MQPDLFFSKALKLLSFARKLASQVKHMQQHCVIYFHHHLLRNALVSVVPLTPSSRVLLCSNNKRKKQLDANQAKLLLCTYMIHRYALLKESTKKNFKVQAVIRSWNLHNTCHHSKLKMSLKEDLKKFLWSRLLT